LGGNGLPVGEIRSRAVYQRNFDGSPIVAPLSVNNAGASLEYRVLNRSTGTSGSWLSFDTETGGVSRADVNLDAGWYDVIVRNKSTQAQTQQIEKVGVGDVFVVAGQSNSENFGGTNPGQIVDERVSAYNLRLDQWVLGKDPQTNKGAYNLDKGSPWSYFGNYYTQCTNVPIHIISVGWGNTRVEQWTPSFDGTLPGNGQGLVTTSLYVDRLQPAINQVKNYNGARALFWHQGENDVSRGTGTQNYSAWLNTIINQTRSDIGDSTLPWFVALVSEINGESESKRQPVLNGQIETIISNSNVTVGSQTDKFLKVASLIEDGVHFSATGLDEHAKEWFNALKRSGLISELNGCANLAKGYTLSNSGLLQDADSDGFNDRLEAFFTDPTDPVDTTPPVITFTPSGESAQVNLGEAVPYPVVSCSDGLDGDRPVTDTGPVSTSAAGEFARIYNCADIAGNPAQKTFRVTVLGDTNTPEDGLFTITTATSGTIANLAAADNAFASGTTLTANTATINFRDVAGNTGRYAGDVLFPNMPAGGNDFAIKAQGTFYVAADGLYTFGTRADDGIRLAIDGVVVLTDDALHGQLDKLVTRDLTAGYHTLELVFFERGGGAALELFWAAGSLSTWNTVDFELMRAVMPATEPDVEAPEVVFVPTDEFVSIFEGDSFNRPAVTCVDNSNAIIEPVSELRTSTGENASYQTWTYTCTDPSSNSNSKEFTVETKPAQVVEKLTFLRAKQKDTYQNNQGIAGAEKAIDGSTNGQWVSGPTNSVTHTATGSNTWWQGDLGVIVAINRVTLFNRINCCADRLDDFYILVSDVDLAGMTLLQARNAASTEVFEANRVPSLSNSDNSKTYMLPVATTGRYIAIFKQANNVLSLAEVEAYGDAQAQDTLAPQVVFSPDKDLLSISVNQSFSYPEVTCNDPGGAPISPTFSGPTVSTIEPNSFTRIYTCTDAAGNTSSRNFTIVVSGSTSNPDTGDNFAIRMASDPYECLSGSFLFGCQSSVGRRIEELSDAESVLNSNVPDLIETGPGESSPVINFSKGGGSGGNFRNGDADFPLARESGYTGEDIALRATIDFEVAAAGWYVFGVTADDGFRLKVNGQEIRKRDPGGAPESIFGEIELDAGVHSLDLLFFQDRGGAELELYATKGRKISDNFNDYNGLALLTKTLLSSGVIEPSLSGASRLNFTSAKQKDTYQSNQSLAGAQKAIDNNINGLWSGQASTNSVTHTLTATNTWWQGDLGSSKEVGQITLYNRIQCCSERLNDFYLLVSDQDIEGMSLDQARAAANLVIHELGQVPSTSNIDNSRAYQLPSGTRGRYISIFKQGNDYLSLAEVVASSPLAGLDTFAPHIIFSPDNDSVSIPVGGSFDYPEVRCIDSIDPNPRLSATNVNVNTSIVDEYVRTYTCIDASGNSRQRTFTVNVGGDWLYTVRMVQAPNTIDQSFDGTITYSRNDVRNITEANVLLNEPESNRLGANDTFYNVPSINYSLGGASRGDFAGDRNFPITINAGKDQYFAIRATAEFNLFYDGYYVFKLRAASGAKLSINNKLIIEDESDRPGEDLYGVAFLQAGFHDLEIIYYNQSNNDAQLELSVARSGNGSLVGSGALNYELMSAGASVFDIDNVPTNIIESPFPMDNGISGCDINSTNNFECIKLEIARRNAAMLAQLCSDGLASCQIGKEYGALVDIPSLEADVDFGTAYWRVWTGVGASVNTQESNCIVPLAGITSDWSTVFDRKACFIGGENGINEQVLIDLSLNDTKEIALFERSLQPKFEYAIWNYDNYRDVNWDYSGAAIDPDLMTRDILNQRKPVLLDPSLFGSGELAPGVYSGLDAANAGCWNTRNPAPWGTDPNTWGCRYDIAVGESNDATPQGRVDGRQPEAKFSVFDLSAELGLGQALHVGLTRCRVPTISPGWQGYINLTMAEPDLTDLNNQFYCDLDFVDFEEVSLALAADNIAHAEKVQLIFDVVSTVASVGASGALNSAKLAAKSAKYVEAIRRLKQIHDTYEYTLGLTTLFAEAYVFSSETVNECKDMPEPGDRKLCFAGAVAGVALALATTDLTIDQAADAAFTVMRGVDNNIVPDLDQQDIADIIADTRRRINLGGNNPNIDILTTELLSKYPEFDILKNLLGEDHSVIQLIYRLPPDKLSDEYFMQTILFSGLTDQDLLDIEFAADRILAEGLNDGNIRIFAKIISDKRQLIGICQGIN
jgi:hypothetical protein